MKVPELMQNLKKGQLAPLILVLGEEQALRDQAVAALRAVIPADQVAMNFASYDMQQTPVGVALDDASSQPFFGERREVMITNPYFLTGEKEKNKLDHDLAGLTAYFQNPVPSTVMVIVAPYPKLDERKKLTKALKKNAWVVEATQMREAEAKRAIQSALRQDKIAITPDGLETLAQRTNANYSTMMVELPKLKLYASNGAKLDGKAVSELVPKQLSDRVFDLVEAVVKKDVTTALSIYRDLLLQKEEPIRLNSLLISQFRLLLQVQLLANKGYSQGDITSTLKVHPYRVKLALQQSRKGQQAELIQAYIGLVDTEAAMKTGRVDKQLAFELFVLRYTGQKHAIAR